MRSEWLTADELAGYGLESRLRVNWGAPTGLTTQRAAGSNQDEAREVWGGLDAVSGPAQAREVEELSGRGSVLWVAVEFGLRHRSRATPSVLSTKYGPSHANDKEDVEQASASCPGSVMLVNAAKIICFGCELKSRSTLCIRIPYPEMPLHQPACQCYELR